MSRMTILLLFCSVAMVMNVLSLPLSDENDGDGTIVFDNPNISGEDQDMEDENDSSLPLADDDKEGTIISDNPSIKGEDEQIDDPKKMFNDDLFDGDMDLTETQKREYAKPMRDINKYKWPKSANGQRVIVRYVIREGSPYTADQLALIRQAMRDIEKRTCIRFKVRNNDKQRHYLDIYSGTGCNARVGRIGGKQGLSLDQNGCMIRKKICHELIHALGFNHMHRRYDRDNYVTINEKNITPGKERCFAKIDSSAEKFKTRYDYRSCMHYPRYAFSISNDHDNHDMDTIVPKDLAFRDIIGQVKTLSKGDARRINRLYECSGYT